jgi:hypothetical protein
MRRIIAALTCCVLSTLILPVHSARAQQCFTQPGISACFDEPFQSYWNDNGGLPVFGYPISQPGNTNNFLVQWTERARLEAHPENAAPYNVLLGRIGAERLAQLGRDTFREGREAGPLPGCLWFEETGHNVCDQQPNNGFMTYWQSHGLQLQNASAYARSLALFGLPLTAAQPETSSTGEQLITQWFERARFEWHPNNPSQSRVLLGLLGNETRALNATSSPVGATVSSGVVGMAADAGVNWVRVGNIDWPKVEPTPGARNWDALGGIESQFVQLSSRGMTPVVVIYGTPAWAQQQPGSTCGPIKPEALDAFANFVRDAVARYSAPPYNVRFWEIWNEPDVDPALISPDMGVGCWGNASDPGYGGGAFATMLKRVYPAVKQANPDAQVVLGGLLLDCDAEHPVDNKDCSPSRFLEGVLQNGGGAYFDILGFHGYAYWGPVTSDWDMGQPSWAHRGGATLGKLDYLRAMLARYKTYKPILMTEAALLCRAPDELCRDQFPEGQTNYLLRLYTRLSANGVLGGIWYTFDGPGWYGSGILDIAQQPRLAYHAMQFIGNVLQDAQYIGPLSNGTVEGYAFQKGALAYHVLWTNSDATATLPLPPGTQKIYNKVGQASVPSGGSVTVGFEPVVLEIQQ